MAVELTQSDDCDVVKLAVGNFDVDPGSVYIVEDTRCIMLTTGDFENLKTALFNWDRAIRLRKGTPSRVYANGAFTAVTRDTPKGD
jgi:hypothetical protein